MEKASEIISIRVPLKIKQEYDALSDIDKKHLKRMLLETTARYCFAKNHYDPEIYFHGWKEEELI